MWVVTSKIFTFVLDTGNNDHYQDKIPEQDQVDPTI